MKSFSFLFLFLSVVLSLSCQHKEKQVPRDIASLQANGGMEGIWFLQGTSSSRGPYNGELELRKASDGTFDVVRIVTYINYFFDGLKVQEVWTGKAVATPDSLTVTYDIRQADFIKKLGTLKRADSDFAAPITIISRYAVTPNGLATQYSDKKESSYSEWITTRRTLELKPLWVDQRHKISAKGPKVPLFVQGVIKAFKWDIGYEKDPWVKSFRHKPEFKNENPYLIYDPTDFEFYRKNKDVIRVANKIVDEISITESVVKRNAYALTLTEKAKSFDRKTSEYNLNEAGVISYSLVDQQGHLKGHVPDIDAALWTGMYLGSQAMRYKLTKEPEALENVKKSLRGLMALMEITGDPQQFARTLELYNPAEPLKEKWRRGTGKYQHLNWREGGNNDMLKGITHGFMWAGLVLPESEVELWKSLKSNSRKLIDLQVVWDKPQNKAAALGLAAWLTKDEAFKKQYEGYYDKLKVKVGTLNFDSSFYWNGSADWSGINLSMVGDITDITVADLLGERKIRDKLRERLMDSWVTYQPARRHLLTYATYGYAYKHGIRGDKFKDESSDAKFMQTLKQASWGLREIPYPRPHLDVEIDHSVKPDWCISPTPRLFWKAASDPEPPVSYFYQGLYSYPVFELQAFTSKFIWKDSAFQFRDGHRKGLENFGVDYLYAYWMAKYAGVEDVE